MLELFHKNCDMVGNMAMPKHGRNGFVLFLQTLFIMFLSEVVIVIVMEIGIALCGQSPSLLEDTGDVGQLLMLFATIGPIVGILVASRSYYRRSYDSLGITKKNLLRQYFLGLGIGLLMMLVAVGIASLGNGISFVGINGISIGILVVYFIGFMIQGFSEELIMRGFFMNAYAKKRGIAGAIMINSIIFAFLHLANDGVSILAFLNLMLAGICFSLMAVYFDNIIVCSAAHTMWNFAQGSIFGVLVSGIYLPSSLMSFKNVVDMSWLNGGSFGLEGGMAVTIVEVSCIVLLCVIYRRKKIRKDN